MASTFIFAYLKLKMRFFEIPLLKNIVYSDVLLENRKSQEKQFLQESCNIHAIITTFAEFL